MTLETKKLKEELQATIERDKEKLRDKREEYDAADSNSPGQQNGLAQEISKLEDLIETNEKLLEGLK